MPPRTSPAPVIPTATAPPTFLFRGDDGHVTAWLMNSGHISSIVDVGSAATWHNQGAGDVNGNGTDDILWRNDDGHR